MQKLIIKSVGKALNATSIIAPKVASQKALSLFASPRKGGYTAYQEKLVEQANFKIINFENFKIATYHWPGKNKTILLAHGWESNTSRWSYILDALLKEDYNIVALDAPAHGKSDGQQFNALLYADFINAVYAHFKPEVLVGHSVGGMASVFAKHNYDLNEVSKLVLLGAPAHFTGVFSRYKQMMGYNKKISRGLDRIVLERFGRPVDYFSAANFTAHFKSDGLIIHDKKDPIIPYEDAQLFANRFESSELITTTGFGHSLKDPSLTPKIITFINN